MTDHRIVLRTSDIEVLEGVGKSQASELHAILKISLGRTKQQKVTIREYCDDRGFDYDEILIQLGLTNANS